MTKIEFIKMNHIRDILLDQIHMYDNFNTRMVISRILDAFEEDFTEKYKGKKFKYGTLKGICEIQGYSISSSEIYFYTKCRSISNFFDSNVRLLDD